MTAKWQYKEAYEAALVTARELKAENAKLFTLLKHESEQTEKLRELVRDMWRFGFSENSGANSAAEWDTEANALFDRMCELGVEVD